MRHFARTHLKPVTTWVSLLLSLIATQAMAQKPARPDLSVTVRTFADSFLNAALKAGEFPGAVVVVVKDGKVLLKEGFGYANLERRIPMDPDNSGLSVASVSKLFTVTAVMQQVERAGLKLDADVNTYLDFSIRNPFGGPVRVEHLLTHSGGFDERQFGALAGSEATQLPLGKYLAEHLPPVIQPPGELLAYSNHGIALAGYLVERVSGKPFIEYMQQEILSPLGMTQSSFGRLSDTSVTAVPYAKAQDHFSPAHFRRDLLQIPPAAGLITTGADMARFMVFLLGGEGSGPKIMKPETIALMQARHLGNHPRLPGVTYGSFEHFENGLRGLLNDGDWLGFANRLFLVPEEHLGVFLSLNTSHLRIRQQFITGLLDAIHPVSSPPPQPPVANVDFAPLAGRYRSIALPHENIDKFLELAQLVVTVEPDRTLRLSGLQYSGSPSARFYPIDSLLFVATEGEGYLAFSEDAKGNITRLFLGNTDAQITGGTVMERLPGYGSPNVQISLFLFLLASSLTAFIWPAGHIIRKLRRRSHSEMPRLAARGRVVAAAVCTLILAFLLWTSGWLLVTLGANDLPGRDITTGLRALFVLPIVTVALVATLPYFAWRAWRYQYWSLLGRLHYSILTLAGLLYIPFLIHWNLLGFNF